MQMGDHLAALRLLALTLRDVGAAEAYATAHVPPSQYRELLQMVLSPGDGVEPYWEDACYLISALGASPLWPAAPAGCGDAVFIHPCPCCCCCRCRRA